MKSSRAYLSAFWGRMVSSAACEYVELFGKIIPLPEVPPLRQIRKNRQVNEVYEYRDRIFNQWRTFWMFLGQTLSWTQTCREALRKAQAWLWVSQKKEISVSTSAYCQARNRLNQEYLDDINQKIVEQSKNHKGSSQDLWCGRNVLVVDGSSVSMPDTPKNQALYPQPRGQKKGCGFPVMRIVAIFSLTSGILMAYRKGSLYDHERTLWREMWDCYHENDIVLADCGYCSFSDFELLRERKVDCVMRVHQRRKEKKITRRFNQNDYLVQWEKGTKYQKPRWMTQQKWDQLPDEITVRYVKVSVDIPGIRTTKMVLATTLLDSKKYPAQAIAQLYRQRWLCELYLRDIKTTMRMDVLRAKTPEMIHKELTVFVIAYNLIRFLIWETAKAKGVNPYRISFKGSMATLLQWAPCIAQANGKEKKEIMEALKKIIIADLIPIPKKPRREPRALKRRPNASFQLLTKPRHEFMEIPHRHKYRKNLTLS